MDKNQVTIVQKAMETIDGFEKVFQVIYQQTVLQGKSKSTFNNYIRRIALISLHYNALPENISDDEINEYLTMLALKSNAPSRSSFKHMVYGLRYYFRHIGLNKRAIALPSLKKETKLPVILNRKELKELFVAPQLLKHRIVLTLIYSAGLRGQEVINLKIGDIDFERKTIHIRQSKYKKDRVVPLSDYIAKGLKKYISVENPHVWLFNGKELDGRYSVKGLSWVMREALKKTKIQKQVNLHSLRHSYATHLGKYRDD
jgi:site-specific recombinase XerD